MESRTSRRYETALPANPVGDIGPVPPAAAEGLEERCRIGITVGECLHRLIIRLLIGLFRIEQRQVADVAQFQLGSRYGQALRGSRSAATAALRASASHCMA